MNRQVASFLIASSLALGIPLAADAQPMPGQSHARPHHESGGSQRWLRRLNLTQAQRDQVFQIFHEGAPAMREQMKVVERARHELRQAADAQAKAMSELAFMRAERMSLVVAILTPEQRQRLEQTLAAGSAARKLLFGDGALTS